MKAIVVSEATYNKSQKARENNRPDEPGVIIPATNAEGGELSYQDQNVPNNHQEGLNNHSEYQCLGNPLKRRRLRVSSKAIEDPRR